MSLERLCVLAILHASVRQNEQFSDNAYDRHSEPVPDIESGLRLHTNDLVCAQQQYSFVISIKYRTISAKSHEKRQ